MTCQTSSIYHKKKEDSSSSSSSGQQFIFKKPIYNHHYHQTHYHHHLERHDSFFQDMKQFFFKSKSNHSKSTTSHSSFGNEFNKDLESRYGTWGTFVGKGSGGSVRIIRRAIDNKVFAVKQFRKRRPQESEREYVKKVTAEFCIGSTLHHDNIIETLDIIQEDDRFYEIMEYAPCDLFSVVMKTKLTPSEIGCCWRQLLNGLAYLQDMGIGHRDLKLDNLVMDEHHIIKIIDFGTAVVVRSPFENKERLCSGVCGSDPYIAPEQYSQQEYNAFAADIWSCGIIFVCMVLRRFAWRIPRPRQDDNYRMYLKDQNTLLAYIPRYARSLMAHVLDPNPNQRYSLSHLLADPWVSSLDACTTLKPNDHHHHHPLPLHH
ncbi:kinase-like domain-containing protein [Halteromyces radiatus]|uniref:kinase-like domain-containing protein n=1 Tax=Halteromyces radiatus TaxID=101107 RepID=UPI00221F0695|nr:kinase-like domain-containing protein [Halteromyces radiatus]KAI8079922.1 kinase-like domain-containing protein [Halteromyces radiatus]